MRKWPLTSAVRTETAEGAGAPTGRKEVQARAEQGPRCPWGGFMDADGTEDTDSHRDRGLEARKQGSPGCGPSEGRPSRSPAGQVTGAGTPHLRVAGTPVTARRPQVPSSWSGRWRRARASEHQETPEEAGPGLPVPG